MCQHAEPDGKCCAAHCCLGDVTCECSYLPDKGVHASLSAVCLLVTCLTSQQRASVSQGRICTDNFMCCHTEIEVADLSTSPSHSILTPGRPVPALTLSCQAPGRVATGVPIFKSLVWLSPEKSSHKRDSNPESSVPEADALITRPSRQSLWAEMKEDDGPKWMVGWWLAF